MTFSAQISSDIERNLLPSVKTRAEIIFLTDYLNFLKASNDEMLNNGNTTNTNNSNKSDSNSLNNTAKSVLKSSKDFIFVLDGFKKVCFLPYEKISKNFEILQIQLLEKQLQQEKESEKNISSGNSAKKKAAYYNVPEKKHLLAAKSLEKSESKNFSSILNSFISEIMKMSKCESNQAQLTKYLENYLSLELLYYPPFKAQLFKALFEIVILKFQPTKTGNYNLNFFNPFFKLRKVSDLRATDLNDETFLAALEEQERKGNIELKYSFNNEDFEAIKKNLIEALNHASSDEKLNDFRSKIAEGILEIAISKEFGELMAFFKHELKDQAQKFLAKSAATKLAEMLSLNSKSNLASIRKNIGDIALVSENPLYEELFPKTLSVVYSAQKGGGEIHVVVLNQYGLVQYHNVIGGVEFTITEAEENLEFELAEKCKEQICLLLKLHDPEVIVIGTEDAFGLHLKKSIDCFVKRMYQESKFVFLLFIFIYIYFNMTLT